MASDPTQEALLHQLKQRVNPLIHDKFKDGGEEWLVKWLIASNNNVDHAVDAFKSHVEWRTKLRLDDVPKSYKPPPVVAIHHVGGYVGPDKQGHPVLFLPFRLADLRGLRRSTKVDDWVQHAVDLLEEGKRLCRVRSELLGRPVSRIYVVFDVRDVPLNVYLWRPFFEVAFSVIKTFEDHYPEFLHKAVVFNSPPLFAVALKMVGQALRRTTLDRITVLGGDRNEWTRVILGDVEAKNWPEYWGGTRREGVDGSCSATLGTGGSVHSSFFLHPEDDPPSELVGRVLLDGAGPLIRERVDSLSGPVVRERLETVAGHLLSERLVNDTGTIVREWFNTQVGPVLTERIPTVSGPVTRESLETSGGTLLREVLESERGRQVTERMEAATARLSRRVDEQLAHLASELATASELLAKRFDNEEVFHIPREFKLIYPVKVEEADTVLRWIYFLEGNDIDFVVKYEPTLDEPVFKQVREALMFDPAGPEEARRAIVLPRTRISGTTDPVEDSLVCERPGTYFLEFSNAYSRRKTKVVHIAVQVEPPKVKTPPTSEIGPPPETPKRQQKPSASNLTKPETDAAEPKPKTNPA